MEAFELKDKKLKQAVKDYYSWMGESKATPVAIVKNKYSSYTMLLAHFVDGQGKEMSSLMYGMRWADGHYDISEYEAVKRTDEPAMVQAFVDSEEWIVEVCDD